MKRRVKSQIRQHRLTASRTVRAEKQEPLRPLQQRRQLKLHAGRGAQFGMYAAITRCTKGVVVCVEPVPEIFTALQMNLARVPTIYPECATRVRALNCGVSDGTIREVRVPRRRRDRP